MRVPRDLQELALRVERVIAGFNRRRGRQPSVEELADELGIEPEDVLEAMEATTAYRAMSLDLPRAAGDDEPGEVDGDTVGQVEDGYHRVEQRSLLEDLMCCLRPRDRDVLRLRFEHDLTQAQIGDILGISQMQVSRVLRQAIAQLRAVAARRHATAGSATDSS